MKALVLGLLLWTTMVVMAQVATEQGSSRSTLQSLPQSGAALTVTGQAGQAPLIHRNGKWYVEVEGLARVTGATLGFEGSRIVLTLPAPKAGAPVMVQQAAVETKALEKGYSREFLQAGVEQISVVREWRSAVENAVRTNNPVEERWVSNYRRIASDHLAMASASATTEADKRALPLLQSVTAMAAQLSDRFLALRTTVTYVSPDTLDNDPLDKKILECAQGVVAQAVPGSEFHDVGACH